MSKKELFEKICALMTKEQLAKLCVMLFDEMETMKADYELHLAGVDLAYAELEDKVAKYESNSN